MTQMQPMGRRQFLRIVGVGALAGVALKTGLDTTRNATVVSETRLLMGTVVNLTLLTHDERVGQAAARACLEEMAGLENVMSRHRPDSQLSLLNQQGHLDNPDPRLYDLLQDAIRLSELTDGAFDITIKPVVDLYQSEHTLNHALPAEDAIQAALALVDYRNVQITPEHIAFHNEGMGITLDGIAKGYIVDQGMTILKQHGFNDIMVEAGGDLAVSGENAAAQPWKIGIQSPRPSDGSLLTTVNVRNQAVATSGDYMQAFTTDYTEHHILHPQTGHSTPMVASATVVAQSSAIADALATTLLVTDIDQGIGIVEALADCEAYVVTKDISIVQSTGFSATAQQV